LDQVTESGTLVVLFKGGEALIHNDLIQILLYARNKDFSIILLTNGILINNKFISILKQINVAFVQVSLLCLTASGNFSPCPGFDMVLGNVYKDSVRDIWESSPSIKSLRKVTNASFTAYMKCDSLDYCNICPAKLYNESGGDMFKIDRCFCEIAKSEKCSAIK